MSGAGLISTRWVLSILWSPSKAACRLLEIPVHDVPYSSCGLLPKPWLCFRPRSPVTRHPPTARPAHRRRNWTIPADEPRGGPTRAQGLSFNVSPSSSPLSNLPLPHLHSLRRHLFVQEGRGSDAWVPFKTFTCSLCRLRKYIVVRRRNQPFFAQSLICKTSPKKPAVAVPALKQEKGSAVAVIRTQTSRKIETGNDGGYAVAPPGQFRKLTRLTFSPIPHVGYPADEDEPSPCEPKTSTTASTSP
ncbi:hypothetical protein CIHG_00847 [Coccidioides immitis H538.4]|uniref:Uncharacterized protein n=1 Tax=Coccidioides immitis H538.4 TaxID=396776 RepID=A0A0J8RCX5_COCIT|nr:hypothetical protein CIHG_00847 [Coccidioides immitis H538.4]